MTNPALASLCTIAFLLTLAVMAKVIDRKKRNRRIGLPAPSKESTRYCTPQSL